jgi:hypothetical protein
MEALDDFLDGFDLESFLRRKLRWWVLGLFPIIALATLVQSISNSSYDIDTELYVASGENRIHNIDDGSYYFLSKTCTESLLDYHEIPDQDRSDPQWKNCEGFGLLNFTLTHYPSDGNGHSGIVNYSNIECKIEGQEATSLGFSIDEYYYCYGGINLEGGQYQIMNDSPFDVELIQGEDYKLHLTYLFEETPFVSVTMGYISVFVTCCIVPLGLLMSAFVSLREPN